MRTINTDLIEKIIEVNSKILRFAEKEVFNGTWITPTQFNILWEIIVNKEISVNELKEKLIISAPAISQLFNRLESAWFIERKLWKSDKREIKIIPTKKAMEEYNKINEKYLKIADEKLSFLNDNDKKFVINFLDKIEKAS
jgi:DNA-binding MarR family transcriptional regulator